MQILQSLKGKILDQVDQSNPVVQEKVERYISLVDLYYKLQARAAAQPVIEIINGSQRYTKTNPVLSDLNKINASLIALGRDMGLSEPDMIQTGAGYKASDLL